MDTLDEGGFEETVAPEADPITVDGQVDEGYIAPEPNYLDVDQYGDYYAKVKVDGEELDVPVAEALQGYQRQADYTRKTQELSERAQQVSFWETVDRAMQADPATTLQYLQTHYGIGQADAASNTAQQDAEDDWFSDPSEKRIAQLEKQLQGMQNHFEQQQATQLLNQVVSDLQQKYGDEFNAQEVVREAVNRGVSDPRHLEGIFKEMAYDSLLARKAAEADFNSKKAAEEQARKARAAEQASTVQQGAGSNGAVQTPAPVNRPRTIQEAWALAKQQTVS